jgi:sigma-B regulation protein RsbU (phosphoserine phosphatase)
MKKTREFFETYTRDLTSDELGKLFTRETPEAYRFFARGIDRDALRALPWHQRALKYTQAFFLAFTMRLTPARRVIYAVALVACLVGLFELFRGIGIIRVPVPVAFFFVNIGLVAPRFEPGTSAMLVAFLAMNLLVLLEVYDRITLKRDLEVAREIQQAMLPDGTWTGPGVEAFGMTQPANTVGGDFYDILPLGDGRVIVALGDVAGKASPAALLMALVLAMLRTLVDLDLPLPELVRRLNIQVGRHAPASRFITLFVARYDPESGELEYINAGQTPPLLRRLAGSIERLEAGGMALGLFDGSTYTSGRTALVPGDALVMYTDGISEAESPEGTPFDEGGIERTLDQVPSSAAAPIGRALFDAVEAHRLDTRLSDDLTVLVLSRSVVPPIPVG